MYYLAVPGSQLERPLIRRLKEKTHHACHCEIPGDCPEPRDHWHGLRVAGATVVVKGYQARNGTPTATGTTVTFADGHNFFLGSPGTGAPEDKQ